jgi:hypothetical protein
MARTRPKRDRVADLAAMARAHKPEELAWWNELEELAWWDWCPRPRHVVAYATNRSRRSWMISSAATAGAAATTARPRHRRRGYLRGGAPSGPPSQCDRGQQPHCVVMARRTRCWRTGVGHGARHLKRVSTGAAAELVARHGNRIDRLAARHARNGGRAYIQVTEPRLGQYPSQPRLGQYAWRRYARFPWRR